MATFQVASPSSFNFARLEEWPKWLKRFERFKQASGLAAKSEESQINTLIYKMGSKADDILQSFNLSDEDQKKYDTVITHFQDHFIARRNVIFERANFNSRIQEDGESADSFITSLYGLAEHCGFNDLHDKLIRDRIVVGIRDTALAEKLQMDPKLNLQKAVNAVQQSEAVKSQQTTVRGVAKPSDNTVDALQKGRRPQKEQNKQFSSKPPVHKPLS